jgi:hypothetical protein
MRRAAHRLILVSVLAAAMAVSVRVQVGRSTPDLKVRRAVAYLSAEVPRWHAEHGCYSCHNNGDAVRALIRARQLGFETSTAIADTIAFLSRPSEWADNSRGGEFDDQALARIQFAAALTDAVAAGLLPRTRLADAAALVVADQQPDGSWRLDASGSLGSPATYGTALATWAARRTLVAAGRPGLRPAIARADAWIRSLSPTAAPDLAAVLLVLAGAQDDAGAALRSRAQETLLANQHASGGWGPYPTVRPEPFDTALAVIALSEQTQSPRLAAAIARGRAYLIGSMQEDGSWLETTRPAGQQSYAQRISTTAWALLATD